MTVPSLAVARPLYVLSFATSLALAFACSRSSSDSPAPPDERATEDRAAPPAGSAPGSATRNEPGTTITDGGAPSVLLVGRFDTTDPAGPKAAWPGSRILTRFEGTAISVKLSEFAEPWMEGAPSYWEVSIDKGPYQAIAMIADNQPHDFELATGLPAGPHLVELFKRSETQTGITQFLGFDLHGGRALGAPPRQERRIEVMGDSQSTGFGIEMIDAPQTDCPGADHSAKYQNFRKAWGNLLGLAFDAEVHGIVYSGKGVLQNVWPTDTDPLIRYYPRANPNPAIQNSNPPLFDLSSWVPDVVVLAQGAMDFNSGVAYAPFREAYRTFVIDTLRARGPSTHIVMAVLGKGGREEIPRIGAELIEERARVGDTGLSVFVATLYEWTEMLGCNGHGTPSFHQRIADELAAHIRGKVGWQ